MAFYLPNILLAVPRNPITALGLPLALGFLSGSPNAKVANSNWYHGLQTPPGCPPKEAFPFVWTPCTFLWDMPHIWLLPLSIALSPKQIGLTLYYAQLGLNCLWNPIFFGTHQTGLALIDSLLLTATTWYMTKLLDRPTDAGATYFLLPYCAWLGYATYLNAGTWWLNRDRTTRKDT